MISQRHNLRIIPTNSSPQNQTILSYWSPPRSGWFKINTDGAWDPNTSKGGVGLVTRDSFGLFLSAAAMHINTYSAEEAEIRAIWTAMKQAMERKITALEIESDAKVVVEQLKRKNYCGAWNTDALLKDIEVWSLSFEKLSFNYVPRVCNRVAHELAQWGKNSTTDMFWGTPPVWLLPVLRGDQFLC
ncbi:Ribonuclease H domain [Macleaya cordata]|nr:Ribonuclease H domain [Macleaya cordata]